MKTEPTSVANVQAELSRLSVSSFRDAVFFCLLSELANQTGWWFGIWRPVPEARFGSAGSWLVSVASVSFWLFCLIKPVYGFSLFTRWKSVVFTLAVFKTAGLAMTGGLLSPLTSLYLVASWPVLITASPSAALVTGVLFSGCLAVGSQLSRFDLNNIAARTNGNELLMTIPQPFIAALIAALLGVAARVAYQRVFAVQLIKGSSTHGGVADYLVGVGELPVLDPPIEFVHPIEELVTGEEELLVLYFVRDGFTINEIALETGFDAKKVYRLIDLLKKKLGADTLWQLAAICWKYDVQTISPSKQLSSPPAVISRSSGERPS